MVDDSRKLSITYSSRLIPPPEIMSTLAVFYDEVWLPYSPFMEPTPVFHSGFLRNQTKPRPVQLNHRQRQLFAEKREYGMQLGTALFKWHPLFEEGILQLLPHPVFETDRLDAGTEKVRDAVMKKRKELSADFECIGRVESLYYMTILAVHMVRTDKPSPELFISNPADTRTSRLAGFLVQSLFQYQVPQLGTLNAEQILEVREYLKDTKEGFTYYIHEMTDYVEQRLKGGNLSEITAAQKTFERKILPQYEEFRRQLVSRKTGYWANVLSASADFLKVDATPWTPKFYGELLKWLGKYLRKSFLTLCMPTPSDQGLIDATKPAPEMLDYF